MFLRGETNRVGAVVALALLLTLTLAAPAGAAGWSGWSEVRGLAEGLLPRALAWLGLDPKPGTVLKCSGDQGLSIDPNGCPKAGGSPSTTLQTKDGFSIDPNGKS